MKNIPFNTGLLNVKRLNDRNRSDASEDNHYESFSFRLFLSSPERKAEERRCADIVSPPRNWDGVLRAVIYDRGYEKGGGRTAASSSRSSVKSTKEPRRMQITRITLPATPVEWMIISVARTETRALLSRNACTFPDRNARHNLLSIS